MMIGISNHLLSMVFKIHYHSQKVIGSLRIYLYINIYVYILEYPSSQDGSGKVKVTEALDRNRDVLDFPQFLY